MEIHSDAEAQLVRLYRQLNATGKTYLAQQMKMISQEKTFTKPYVETDGIRYITVNATEE